MDIDKERAAFEEEFPIPSAVSWQKDWELGCWSYKADRISAKSAGSLTKAVHCNLMFKAWQARAAQPVDADVEILTKQLGRVRNHLLDKDKMIFVEVIDRVTAILNKGDE